MVALEQLYLVIVAVLLLVALGVSIPVLARIVRDGLERRRERRTGELERYTEDEEYDRVSATPLDGTTDGRRNAVCRQCGTENDPEYTYCRRCLTPL